MERLRRRRESGSALLVAVLMLTLMGFLGLAALDTVRRDSEVAGMQNRAKSAFYAAEAGVASAREILRSPVVDDRLDTPAFPTQGAPQNIGDVGLYDREFGQLPRFFGDPNPPDPANPAPIHWWKDGRIDANGGNLQMKGQKFVWTLWRINVVGQSPDGARSRVEVVEAKKFSSTQGGSY